MKEMIALVRGALTLDAKTFDELKQSPEVFRKGFTLILVIGLIVGVVLGLVGIVQGLTTSPAAALAATEQSMRMFEPFLPPGVGTQFLENLSVGTRIAERIEGELKTPWPRSVGTVFHQLGVMVSYPLGWLGSLIFYGALVHVFAKLVGGRGTIAQMLGVTSLTVVPHLLDALGFIPCLGGLLGLIAWAWGVVIYVKGTATAHEVSTGKATLAVLMPFVVLFLLAVLFALIIVVLSVAARGGR